MKEKSPRILPWALCHLEGREMRTGRVAETARARAGPELCDSVLQGSPVRPASLGIFTHCPGRYGLPSFALTCLNRLREGTGPKAQVR